MSQTPMDDLIEKLDNVGWTSINTDEWQYGVFAWMQKANSEIIALRRDLNAEAELRGHIEQLLIEQGLTLP